MRSPPSMRPIALVAAWCIGGCGGDTTTRSNPGTIQTAAVEQRDMIFITDRTGKRWDVTHARDKYGLVPSGYQYGLGPYAIRPILNPQMLFPDDLGYPESSEYFLVLGTSLSGFARAYPIAVLSRHEVANEQFGDIHVAVAY